MFRTEEEGGIPIPWSWHFKCGWRKEEEEEEVDVTPPTERGILSAQEEEEKSFFSQIAPHAQSRNVLRWPILLLLLIHPWRDDFIKFGEFPFAWAHLFFNCCGSVTF